MINRSLRSILLAMALAVAAHATASAARPAFLVCVMEDASEIRIIIDNFGGMREAVHQCLTFWKGKPHRVER
jgi:DNA phosphorothioation-dependent restriction protein DptG